MSSDLDRRLRRALSGHPRKHDNRYTPEAKANFLEILFRSLTNDREDYLQQLFPDGFPESFRLQDVQGAEEDAEYTEAARGHPCGHIFKQGEASYHCMTCTSDPTAVLCSRCFVASDHEGHIFHISQSSGNSGCCDCGDEEAWKRPVHCAIHTATDDYMLTEADVSALPDDLQNAIRVTVSRILDFVCDVISCSPENLRTPKTIESVRQDEIQSRFKQEHYEIDDEVETNPDFCLVLWNDEKHTISEVRDQVARACRERERYGWIKAEEANDYGRCVIRYSRNLKELLRMAKVIEEIKVTVTIRSARDTYREQMCDTIIQWLSDISACQILGDSHILRRTVCEEMLHLWRIGSTAFNAKVGKDELDDHEKDDNRDLLRKDQTASFIDPVELIIDRALENIEDEGDEDPDMDDGDIDIIDEIDAMDSGDDDEDEVLDDANTERDVALYHTADAETTDDADEMDTDNDFSDVNDRLRGERARQASPPRNLTGMVANEPAIAANTETLSRQHSESVSGDRSRNYQHIPKTPTISGRVNQSSPNHWTIVANKGSFVTSDTPVYEDLRKNIRIDSMILFDLRLWKSVRINMRDLLITTVINIPQFKRILGLRFAGLYTTMAQLYLVADREPDHSIINLSLQLLTTPSITEEVVEKNNFLTVLMAILYTFLTTRQVGFPDDVDVEAVLGFDAGSVANRRLYHFFSDLRYFLASKFVQAQIRSEKQYIFQYLDLAKLSQGICPNTRAVGEHVEYETDAWISASLLTREINKVCRQFAEAYQIPKSDLAISLAHPTCEAIVHTARAAITNSIGLEHQRFEQSEIRDIVKFHPAGPYPFSSSTKYKVVQFVVEKGTLSFHHPLHYTLSWLLEGGKESASSILALQEAASGVVSTLLEKNTRVHGSYIEAIYTEGEDALLALFDYPLRVCAWLAQMKANLWVRNGMSLRHQMSQYKSVAYRDAGHYRDLYLLQTALVACHPGRVLAQILDRYGLQGWVCHNYSNLLECDQTQMLDLVEDFLHLLINLLSDRDVLMSRTDDPESQLATLRKDIAHTLCFKPLSFSDLTARLTERAQDHEHLQDTLVIMTNYKPPEGLHDTGLYELKQEHLEELDPYNSHFTKNQRDEAENIYKAWKSKQVNKSPDDIVLVPKLHPIQCEAYANLTAVTKEPLFANMVHSLLLYALTAKDVSPIVSATKTEAFLQVLLHLVLIATLEDQTSTTHAGNAAPGFVEHALRTEFNDSPADSKTVVQALNCIWSKEEFAACRGKIKYILRIFKQKRPADFGDIASHLDLIPDRLDTSSPANVESEIEAKKKQALARKAKIMAQMQRQQQSFMANQGVVDWGDDDLDDAEPETPSSIETRLWKFPTGVCIQCREETNDSRLYGTFAMVTDDHILRQTPVDQVNLIREACLIPSSLDRSMEDQRPYGMAGANHQEVKRMTSDGQEIVHDRQGLGQGWPHGWTEKSPVSTSCGHIMHFTCFENYYQSVVRRHTHQIARNHPERKELKEFVCPLCKALANVFLPIVWKSTEQSYPGTLTTGTSFDIYMDYSLPSAISQPLSKETMSQNDHAQHIETMLSFNAAAMTPVVDMLKSGEFPPSSDQLLAEPQYQSGAIVFKELSDAYKRLYESITIVSKTQTPAADIVLERSTSQFDLLLHTLANSVTAVETAFRGRDADLGSSVLGSIPASTLSHLQVMASTLRAYAATRGLNPTLQFGKEYQRIYAILMHRLFGATAGQYSKVKSSAALETDGFKLFAVAAMTICRSQQFPVYHMLRICLTLELVRVAASYLWYPENKFHDSLIENSSADDISIQHTGAVGSLLAFMERNLHAGVPEDIVMPRRIPALAMVARAMRAHALIYLRKATIFLHVACKVDLPAIVGAESSLPELDRLTHLLQLPNIFTILSDFSEYSGNYSLHRLAKHWLKDCTLIKAHDNGHITNVLKPIRLLHPAPLELIGLPKYFDVLIEESHRRRCPTTGKELTDPALCLFCGEIFCAQAVCCMDRAHRGGCNRHLDKCSFPIGLFLFIRKCHVVMLHVVLDPVKVDREREILTMDTGLAITTDNARHSAAARPVSINHMTISHGGFFPAPYLTKHGETDCNLRSKHQLILNQKRYDRLLRDTWLMVNGSVWSTVARKLEGEVNAGGWETL